MKNFQQSIQFGMLFFEKSLNLIKVKIAAINEILEKSNDIRNSVILEEMNRKIYAPKLVATMAVTTIFIHWVTYIFCKSLEDVEEKPNEEPIEIKGENELLYQAWRIQLKKMKKYGKRVTKCWFIPVLTTISYMIIKSI